MQDIILTVLDGSHAHGIASASSDFDYTSIRVAPLTTTLGIGKDQPASKHLRKSPQGTRARPGDEEHTIYELRHYVRLASDGNPNMLVPLFVHPQFVTATSDIGEELRGLARKIVSRQALVKHLGYLEAQRGRMTGDGPHQSRKPNRPELIEAHGYDTKYAAHALRLGWQGIQLATLGELVLPMYDLHAAKLRDIRAGYVEEAEVLELIDRARDQLVKIINGELAAPNLREHPDYETINQWLIRCQRDRVAGTSQLHTIERN